MNLSVLPGQLVAVVGQVGSGKSSLVQAILGELHKMSGDVAVRGSIAYIAQTAFIMNATLKVKQLYVRYLPHRWQALQDVVSLLVPKPVLPISWFP